MSIDGTIIALKVRAKTISDHAFNAGGLVEGVNLSLASIGSKCSAFDIRASLYPHLSEEELDGTGQKTGRLIYDSIKLRAVLQPLAIAYLSNESSAVDLDQAILRRQNQFLARDQFSAQLDILLKSVYPDKINRLKKLLSLLQDHFAALNSAYNPGIGPAAGVTSPRVVMATTVSGLGSRHDGTTQVTGGAQNQTHTSHSSSVMTRFDPAANGGAGDWVEVRDNDAMTLSQQTVSIAENDELRHPNLENQMRFVRVSADLLDEILAESTFGLTVPNLTQIWKNELRELDLEIRRLQVIFSETFLLPRVSGIITAQLRGSGDSVRAGEPVVRIENVDQIMLNGQVKVKGRLYLGQTCTVETSNVFGTDPAEKLSLPARIVSLRG